MKPTPLIFVLYDGIENSIFSGQVLAPLVNKAMHNPDQEIILLSFEHRSFSAQELQHFVPENSNIQVRIAKKIPYVGKFSLYFATWQLRKLLKKYSTYQLLARGPLAGLISLWAAKHPACTSITIQARGLLAAEYSYAHEGETAWLKRQLYECRARQFSKLERCVFGKQNTQIPVTIQAVSPALKKYLIDTYEANSETVKIAHNDIPEALPKAQALALKAAMRFELSIPYDSLVFCYNGSIKPWQCPELVVSYFKEQLSKHPTSFLLVLTQDQKAFITLLEQNNIQPTHYRVLTVKHNQIYAYLAAADIGLIFRQPHIINWVSRPTKALEYKAAHLEIVHNNTVAWLTNNNN